MKGIKIMSTENKLQEVVQSTLAQIKNMIDADTVIGTPINTDAGVTIIPISKVTVGFATSGLEFNDKAGGAQNKPQNFGSVGGSGISVQPVALLCVDQNGSANLINIGMKNPTEPVVMVADILDRAPEIIAKIKNIFKKPEDNTQTEEVEETKEKAD